MVSKNQIKLITRLHLKKYRQEDRLFIAEGVKVIRELLNAGYVLEILAQREELFTEVPTQLSLLVSEEEMKKLTALSSPSPALAVFRQPQEQPFPETGFFVALDDIRDPGNMGTILRLCDWFGVDGLICSKGTVELYNPKVVQATMGSLTRIPVQYVDLPSYLAQSKLPVIGTDMQGEVIYTAELPQSGILVMGNEANGMSAEVEAVLTSVVSIPRFGKTQQTESLNVATATSILLSEWARRSLK